MKILVISYHYPPYNVIGAVRVSKFTKYLHQKGHNIRVISASHQQLPQTLAVEIPSEKVIYATSLRKRADQGFNRLQDVDTVRLVRPRDSKLRKVARKVLGPVLHIPDAQNRWFPGAYKAARQLVDDERPDIILASARPYTALIVAAGIAKRYDLPWVADLRDLWVDNHHYPPPRWRMPLDKQIEKLVLNSAAGMVTVSEPLANILRAKFRQPVEVILNGFDADDHRLVSSTTADSSVNIVYTGTIDSHRRDPRVLLQALALLGPLAQHVRLRFYGPTPEDLHHVLAAARELGVASSIEVNKALPYRAALEIQRSADLLLLVTWNDPSEEGVYTGKLFEYIAARRPIIGVGCETGVAAELIRTRRLGMFSNSPADVADRLRSWVELKRSGRAIPPPPAQNIEDLSRRAQTRRLEQFLIRLLEEDQRNQISGTRA